MRSWRKLYASMLDSEQVAALSDGATVLLTLLIAAQDDTGYWPWTPAKVRRLIASRPAWTVELAQSFADELVTMGIAQFQEGGILLVKGQALNGLPRPDLKEEVTPRNEFDTPRNESVPLEKKEKESRKRAEKKEKESKTTRVRASSRSDSQITAEFLEEMHTEFSGLVADVDKERKKCELWWQERRNKSPSKLALRNWLEKAVKIHSDQKAGSNGEARKYHKGPPADAGSDYYGPELIRMPEQDIRRKPV